MIEVKHLCKSFGLKDAVKDISFVVEKGEILGFLGPNGAGKSTTMRMITGFIPPTSGTAVIGGYDITKRSIPAREKIGYLPENAPVYPDMTVRSYLDFCAQIRGYTGAQKRRKVSETIEKCFLPEVEYQTINTLSKGFKQRVCFAQSILHDPDYLILDEPTDGLDPNQKHEVRMMIKQMSAEKAIILSTHILEEMDAVCDRVIIISAGRIVADETPGSLRERSALHGAVLLTLTGSDPDRFVESISRLEGVRLAKLVDSQSDSFQIRIFPEQIDKPIVKTVLDAVSRDNGGIESIFVEQGRLDKVFRRITSADSV